MFEKFVRKTVDALKEYCSFWCTINEPNAYALSGYVAGTFPTKRRGLNIELQKEHAAWTCGRISRHP
ncbi:MAG: family 1 glycosylhydrolase [Anaerolineales bacterium]